MMIQTQKTVQEDKSQLTLSGDSYAPTLHLPGQIFPPKPLVFRAFNSCPLAKVKVRAANSQCQHPRTYHRNMTCLAGPCEDAHIRSPCLAAPWSHMQVVILGQVGWGGREGGREGTSCGPSQYMLVLNLPIAVL
jgi:hypothetical protein